MVSMALWLGWFGLIPGHRDIVSLDKLFNGYVPLTTAEYKWVLTLVGEVNL